MRNTVQRGLRHKTSETTDKGMARAGAILEVARALFATEGYARLSMRGVAAGAGITLGTVQHYYRSKEELFEAMLLHTLEDMQDQADRMAGAEARASPARQFEEAMRYFTRVIRSPMGQGTFTELKALALRDPFAAEVMERILVRARKSIGRRIRALDPRVSTAALNRRSALVLAQLMGLSFLESGGGRRRRADLAGLDEATLALTLAVARGDLLP
jgi:AcrR family transcriptional regulator